MHVVKIIEKREKSVIYHKSNIIKIIDTLVKYGGQN